MDTLPTEMLCELGKYLTSPEIKVIGLVDSRWNHIAKYMLHKRRGDPMTFTFNSVKRLARFNDTFANYEPMEDLASATFCFRLPVLASRKVSAHLVTFTETFGQSVSSLTLHFLGSWPYTEGAKEDWMAMYWSTSEKREVLDKNLTLLLAKVKGQLQTLEFKDYVGLSPSVFGSDAFPVLSSFKVHNIKDLFVDGTTLERIAAIQEACVLELSLKVPAIQEFDLAEYNFGPSDDPAYLATVLRNLVLANPEVRSKLNLCLPSSASRQSLKFVQKLSEVDTRIHQLTLLVPPEGGNREDFRLLMEYVGGQSRSLRKLILVDSRVRRDLSRNFSPHELRLPSMRVLEELDLCNVALMPVHDDGSANYLATLRHVTMSYHGHDLAVTLPSVTHLTLLNFGKALEARTAGEDFRRFVSNFPNLWSLTCSAKFLALPAIFSQVNLTRLKIRDHERDFWDIVAEGAPRLTFGQIVDLDVTPGRDAEGPSFKDLGNLREVILQLGVPVEETLNAVLYISKIGKLKDLYRLCVERGLWATNDIGVRREYFQELRKYHDCDVIIN